MSYTIQQSDAEILSNFNNMEEGQEYVLNQFWFSEANRLRKENGWSPIRKCDAYKFVRRGQKLFLNGVEVFDFISKSNLTFTLTFALALAFAGAFALTLAFAGAFAFALQSNGLEKLNKTVSCDGKVVEIDGKTYALKLIG